MDPLFADSEIWQAIRDFGLPTVALVFVSIGGWKSASWFGNHILLPLKEDISAFIKSTAATQEDLKTNQVQLCRLAEAQSARLDGIEEKLATLLQRKCMAES